MAAQPLVWDQINEKFYETGTDRGVYYGINTKGDGYDHGEAWNGLTAFNKSPSGADATALYANNAKYLTMTAAEDFGFTIEAYTYPDGFAESDGSKEIGPGVYLGQQNRKMFGFTCRTLIGNDTQGTELGYKIHLVWGAKAEPTESSYSTVNESPEAITFSWTCSTTPVPVSGIDLKNVTGFTSIDVSKLKPTAYMCIDSRDFTQEGGDGKGKLENLKKLENALYGADEENYDTKGAYLPLPAEVITILFPAAG